MSMIHDVSIPVNLWMGQKLLLSFPVTICNLALQRFCPNSLEVGISSFLDSGVDIVGCFSHDRPAKPWTFLVF